MKKAIAVSIVLLLTAAAAFAHGGHAHTYMGTVTMLHGGGEFMMKTKEGTDVTIRTSAQTTWLHANGDPAKGDDLAVGSRVVVKMNADGKTAATVKMSAPDEK